MEKTKKTIYIAGAGISGLIAAKTLEEHGYSCTVIEGSDGVGGRVKTDLIDGVPFDHGFQVLLTAYPQVQKHLDLDALQLNYFKPGALLFKNGKKQRIGDPLRDLSALGPTLFSTAGSLKDKIKIFTLSSKLKWKSIAEIFAEEETDTLTYLRNYGFSKRIIQNFFVPFFSGIFLEDELRTSSRMFEFVFKMFSEGHAAIPKKGIGAVAEQLQKKLKKTQFEFNTSLQSIEENELKLSDNSTKKFDAAIVTFPFEVKKKGTNPLSWKSCHNLYFSTENQVFDQGIIALLSDKNTLVNNIHYLFDTEYPILSVTVVKKHTLSDDALEKQVREELATHCTIKVTKLLRHYYIANALPDLKNIKTVPTQFSQDGGLFYAGDYILNGSLNAAMKSGELAALQIIERL